MAAYMKDRFAFLGIGSTDRRRAQRPFVAAVLAGGPLAAIAAAQRLWLEPERELQYVGCDLLRRAGGRLPASALGDVRALVASKSWWDTVDSLAKVVGDLVLAHGELAPELDAWVLDDDLWVARAAILHQLGWKDRVRPEVVFRYCESRIDEPDLFIRKAIGWALRDLARTFPEEVWGWVDTHPDLSGLSRREATKHRPR
jgi:3-methyladenine DNA glycosylase AlkD